MNARTILSSVLLALILGAVTACGSADSTTAATPEIRAALNEVDDAIVAEDYPDANQALRELKRLVIEARTAGALSDEQSGAILTASNQLLDELGANESNEPETEVVSPPASEAQSEETDDEKPEKDKGPDKGTDKPDKPEEKEDGPGNSENAPGHQDD